MKPLRKLHHCRLAIAYLPLLGVCGLVGSLAFSTSSAQAFPHVVRPGETLAQIAERTYGKVQMEQVLVAANGLDAGGGVPVVAGLRLEVPAVSHHRVSVGETWAGLAEQRLGAADRSDVLALANDASPWIDPTDGQEIIIPYNLRYVAGPADTLLTIAYRFLGDRDKAWMLDKYNRLKQEPVRAGNVILVPLVDLPLTQQGKDEAASAGALVRSEGAGQTREAQRKVDSEMPQLTADVRTGRYVDAIAHGNRMLGYGQLAKTQVASIQRLLVEAYVALDATGLAETACAQWREADTTAQLDPVELSPKILHACTSTRGLPPVASSSSAPPDAASSATSSAKATSTMAIPRR